MSRVLVYKDKELSYFVELIIDDSVPLGIIVTREERLGSERYIRKWLLS